MPMVLRIALWSWTALIRTCVPAAARPCVASSARRMQSCASPARRPGRRPARARPGPSTWPRIGETGAAAAGHVARDTREPIAPLRVLRAGSIQHDEVVLGRLDRERQARFQQLEQRRCARLAGARAPGRPGRQPPVVAQLVELDHQPLGEGRRPADVRPAVRVVADPGRQGHQPRPQLAPVVRDRARARPRRRSRRPRRTIARASRITSSDCACSSAQVELAPAGDAVMRSARSRTARAAGRRPGAEGRRGQHASAAPWSGRRSGAR